VADAAEYFHRFDLLIGAVLLAGVVWYVRRHLKNRVRSNSPLCDASVLEPPLRRALMSIRGPQGAHCARETGFPSVSAADSRIRGLARRTEVDQAAPARGTRGFVRRIDPPCERFVDLRPSPGQHHDKHDVVADEECRHPERRYPVGRAHESRAPRRPWPG